MLVYELDSRMSNEDLRACFESLTSISHAYVVKDSDNQLNKRYGFVVFHTEADLKAFCGGSTKVMY